MASILDVAREAGVAVSTVSLVLNHRDRVSPATRERVEGVINQMGYRPRRRQAGKEGRSGSDMRLRIAFVYTLESMHDASVSTYCREVIAGAQEAIGGSSSSLSIIRGADHVSRDLMFNQQLSAHEFDGVILFGPEASNGYLEFLSKARLPLVVFNRFPWNGRFSSVTLDYYGGSCLAVQNLIDQGHRKIGFVSGSTNMSALNVRQISDAFADTMRNNGLDPSLSRQFNGLEHPESAGPAVRDVIRAGATAVFGGDRVMAMAFGELERAGVRVPEDVSLAGFDNLGLFYQGKALTTVGYDRRRMGRNAVRMLQQLTKPDPLSWMVMSVPTFLIPGETVGAPTPKVSGRARTTAGSR